MNLFTFSFKGFVITFLTLTFSIVFLTIISTELILRLKVVDTHSYEIYKNNFYTSKAKYVVFGDSHAVNGIESSEKLLNLGYAGQNLNSTLKKAIAYMKIGNPSYYVLQLDPHLFSYYRISRDQNDLNDYLFNIKKPILVLFRPHIRQYLFSYWKEWLNNPEKIFSNKKADEVQEQNNISIIDLDESAIKKQATMRVQLHKPINSMRSSKTSLSLVSQLKQISDKGIKICLISYPVSSYYRLESKRYKEYKDAMNYFNDLAMNNNLKYINYFDKYDDKYFSDVDHLNIIGREKLTEGVINDCFG